MVEEDGNTKNCNCLTDVGGRRHVTIFRDLISLFFYEICELPWKKKTGQNFHTTHFGLSDTLSSPDTCCVLKFASFVTYLNMHLIQGFGKSAKGLDLGKNEPKRENRNLFHKTQNFQFSLLFLDAGWRRSLFGGIMWRMGWGLQKSEVVFVSETARDIASPKRKL